MGRAMGRGGSPGPVVDLQDGGAGGGHGRRRQPEAFRHSEKLQAPHRPARPRPRCDRRGFRANALRERKGAAAVFRVIPATVVSARAETGASGIVGASIAANSTGMIETMVNLLGGYRLGGLRGAM